MTRRGFTLVELLTVMAITAILFTIITIPVVQTFNLTRAAQGFSDAQNRARLLIDQISREVGNSAGVRDNSGDRGKIAIYVPGQDGNPERVLLDYAKLDLLMPAQGEPLRGPNGALLNPNSLIDPNGNPNDPANWREDPTLRTPVGQVVLPASAGFKLVRYWVGLRQPLLGVTDAADRYRNPYDRLLTPTAATENLFVLYRADVELRRYDRNTGTWLINDELFVDLDGDGKPDLDDPDFFIADGTAAKAARIRAWLRRSRVVTEISRFDMIQPVFDRRTRAVAYDGNVPRVFSLIQFRPKRISSEPATGMTAVRSGEESANSAKLGADVFRTEFGGWTSTFLRTWPSTLNPTQSWRTFDPWRDGNPYLVGRSRLVAGQPVGVSIFAFDGLGNELTDGVELFDLSEYGAAKSDDPTAPIPAGKPLYKFPFSHAIETANSRPGGTGNNWLSSQALRDMFIPYALDQRNGKVTASFDITEVGNGQRLPAGFTDNRPYGRTGPAWSPQADPTLLPPAANRWTNPAYRPDSSSATINQRFNVLWNDWPLINQTLEKSRVVKRFLDLRMVPSADGTPSPLHPTLGFARARIVPGSEIIVGPDQNAGPNYGKYIRYQRIPTGEVGANQYKLNYVNQPEPDYSQYGFAGYSYDIHDYVNNDLLSAVIQPQYRAGFLELNSRPDEPIPAADLQGNLTGNIFVFYRFQFTEPNDVFAIDYDSRQVMDINLTIRNFPGTTLPNPQTITVKASAAVRNFIR